jgi:phosphoglycerol transferase MdoB-like AlkP superfamily enzyme
MFLATLVTEWLERGYDILVTGDHGINADHLHGETTPEQRDVPLNIIQPGTLGRGNTGEVLSQLQIAPTICHLLGIDPPPSMKAAPIDVG